ncbi:hypothetical protein K3495_g4928 [Podosphaera aphanis]|nr:hypothetical protein K3495_g4928 [Podosphaera aphanis]
MSIKELESSTSSTANQEKNDSPCLPKQEAPVNAEKIQRSSSVPVSDPSNTNEKKKKELLGNQKNQKREPNSTNTPSVTGDAVQCNLQLANEILRGSLEESNQKI